LQVIRLNTSLSNKFNVKLLKFEKMIEF